MKLLFTPFPVLLFICLLFTGCQEEKLIDNTTPATEVEFQVESVSKEDGITLMAQFSDINARFSKNTDFKIIKVTNNKVDHASYIAVPQEKNENFRTHSTNTQVREFYIFPEGNVDGYITVRNEFNPYGNVKMEIFEPQFQHKIYEGNYNRFGSSDLASPVYINYGWWENYEACLGYTHSPTDSNFFNITTVAVFDLLTFMGYTVASLLLVCPGYATFI